MQGSQCAYINSFQLEGVDPDTSESVRDPEVSKTCLITLIPLVHSVVRKSPIARYVNPPAGFNNKRDYPPVHASVQSLRLRRSRGGDKPLDPRRPDRLTSKQVTPITSTAMHLYSFVPWGWLNPFRLKARKC